MEYEIGSLADLISGSHTPHRAKAVQKPLTPRKRDNVEANVTPKEKKKGKLKKPKLIFTPEQGRKKAKTVEDDEAYASSESRDGKIKIKKRAGSSAKAVKRKKTKTRDDIFPERGDSSSSEHDSDNELSESENESKLDKDLEAECPPSEDEQEAADGLTDFQKASEFRQKQKLNRLEKYGDDEANRTIFVGNVPIGKKCKKDMKKIFSQYGAIETVRIRGVPVKDLKSNPKVALIKNEFHPDRSTVIVYVKFQDPSSVDKALAENNRVVGENHIRVSRSNASDPVNDTRKTIFVGNLPHNVEDEDMWKVFSKCGDIASVRVIREKKTQIGKGFGYVNFDKSDGVELALSLPEEELTLNKRILRVRRYTQSVNKQNPQGKFQRQTPGGYSQNSGGQGRNLWGQRQNSGGQRQNSGGQRQGNQRKFTVPYKGAGSKNFAVKKPRKVPRNTENSEASKDSRKETGKGPANFIGFTADKKKKKKLHKGDQKKKRISKLLTSKPK